jgi:hypothetical protein
MVASQAVNTVPSLPNHTTASQSRRNTIADSVRRISIIALDAALKDLTNPFPNDDKTQVHPSSDELIELPPNTPTTSQIPSVTSVLLSNPHARTTYFVHTNKMSLILTLISFLLLILLPALSYLASSLRWNPSSLYAFVGMLLFLLEFRLVHKKDAKFAQEFKVTQPTAILVSVIFLVA